jgi:hypothetical protein
VGLERGDPTIGSLSGLSPPRKKSASKNTTLKVVVRVIDLAFL